jgi:aryl-alcohol dehydrogenase-like predicted oxidoreductase
MKGIGCLLAVLLVFWAIWGCNGSPQKTLVPVRGKLTVDGKPAVGAIVTLHPAVDDPQAVRPTGQTRADGEFELTSYYSGDGAAAKYAVECGRFDALQISVSVADMEAIDMVLPLAAERGLGVIAKRPVANAAWRYGAVPPEEKYHTVYWERLRKLDYEFTRRPMPEAISIALRFTLAQPGVSTAIVGTKQPGRWRENARLLEAGPLPAEEIAALRRRWAEVAAPDWVGQT